VSAIGRTTNAVVCVASTLSSVTASHSCESSMRDGGSSRNSMASWITPVAMPVLTQTDARYPWSQAVC
jgi:hypothetical protein